MRSTQDFVGLAALIAAVPEVFGQAISTSSSLRSNFSMTSVRPPPSPVPTGPSFCCEMLADGVGLNFWWNSTRTPYTATVVTSFIQYDNTVLTELATITNPNAPIGSIPNNIIPTWNEYRGTVLANQTTIASYPTTVIASPTPHLVVNAFMYFTGSWTINTLGATTCHATGGPVDRLSLKTPYVYVEDPPVTRTDSAFLPPPPTDIIDSIILQNPTVTQKYPYFSDCTVVSGTGQPTVHIPVTALTSQSSTTVRRAGDAPAPTTTQDSVTSEPPASTTEPEPAPSSTPVEVDPSSTSNQPVTPPTTTQPPAGPEPTGPANPPPSTVAEPPSPPETTQAPPDSGPTTAANPAPSNVVNPPSPGNTQPPAESGGSPPAPSDAVPPSAGPVAPSNSPSLPFPIAPVPVPTVPPTDDTPTTGDSPTSTPNPGAVVLPGDQTLNPGQQTTISGVVISVPSPAVPDSGATAPVVVVDGTSTTLAAAPSIAPVVIVDGTTLTLPNPEPTQPAAIPVTVGTQVLTLEAPSASGEGVVLPNSETLEIGETTTIEGQTVVASVVTSGTSVATVVEVAGESTTQFVTLPTAVPTESEDSTGHETSGATGTGPEAPEFTGGAVSRVGATRVWGLINALGLLFLGLA